MTSESELIARIRCLEADVLRQWVDLGLVEPHRDDAGYVFDAADVARINLVCDLHYEMGLGHESLPIILSLVDQLHLTRHSLRALSAAVAEQPDEVKIVIKSRMHMALNRSEEN